MRKTVCRVTALLALLGMVAGLATPAYAQKHVARDKAGDVVTFDENANLVGAPDATAADVLRTTVSHTKKRLVITVRLRDLKPLGSQEAAQLLVDIKSRGQLHFAGVTKVGADKPQFNFGRGELQLTCRGTKMQVSAAKNLMKLSMRRSCLANPKKLKASVAVTTSSAAATYLDDGLRGAVNDGGRFGFTPKLKRG